MMQPCSPPYSVSHRTSLPCIAPQRQKRLGRSFPRTVTHLTESPRHCVLGRTQRGRFSRFSAIFLPRRVYVFHAFSLYLTTRTHRISDSDSLTLILSAYW